MTNEAEMKTLSPVTEEVKTVLREQTPAMINEVYLDEDGRTAVMATRVHDGLILGAKRLHLTELPFMLAAMGIVLANPEPTQTQATYH